MSEVLTQVRKESQMFVFFYKKKKKIGKDKDGFEKAACK